MREREKQRRRRRRREEGKEAKRLIGSGPERSQRDSFVNFNKNYMFQSFEKRRLKISSNYDIPFHFAYC
jgi:hypothetical protein